MQTNFDVALSMLQSKFSASVGWSSNWSPVGDDDDEDDYEIKNTVGACA